MTFRILEPPSALPQFPFLPAPVFQALLRHPQTEGCRDWGDAPPSPRGFGASLILCLITTASKSKTSAAHRVPWAGLCCFSKGKRFGKSTRGETSTSWRLLLGRLLTSIPRACPWGSKKQELAPHRSCPERWQRAHPAAGVQSNPSPSKHPTATASLTSPTKP